MFVVFLLNIFLTHCDSYQTFKFNNWNRKLWRQLNVIKYVMSRSNLLEENRWHSPSRERGYMTKKVFPLFLWLKRYSSVGGCFFFYRTLSPLQGKCETYRGNACAEFIGNQSIWVQYRIRHQQNIEKVLSSALAVIRALDHMSERYLQIVTVKWIKLVICTVKTNLRSGVLFWRKNAWS